MIFKGDSRDSSEGNEEGHQDPSHFLEEAEFIDNYRQSIGRKVDNRSRSNKYSHRNGKKAILTIR